MSDSRLMEVEVRAIGDRYVEGCKENGLTDQQVIDNLTDLVSLGAAGWIDVLVDPILSDGEVVIRVSAWTQNSRQLLGVPVVLGQSLFENYMGSAEDFRLLAKALEGVAESFRESANEIERGRAERKSGDRE